ncbi:DUF3047 domain-containing protein [Sedimenticola thiotaurini]|uniref:DUF3047 domain-containing protein n=1 Tax=Sedimenticola thiotaurini TaxID=1543721 RepID=A0A0F7K3T3_9GAMM|nr:DUF3047 domain-containing protein [Sedimenticola thiotaurini]AKH21563.1 hypothetical protein AAY24_15720 [Sedimenticola thiotaurini]
MTFKTPLLAALLLNALLSAPLAADVQISNIIDEGLDGWEEHTFKGNTRYRITALDGIPVISAQSHGTASGLFKEIRVDLEETPYLNWRWRVEQPLNRLDERSKRGDDYSARIYVVKKGGLLPWRTKALNYVWSSSQPAESTWLNAFSSQAQMIAVRSTADSPGKFYSERRNVQSDFQRFFGTSVRYVDVVAIMTDTDNSGQQAHAYYGDIFFSK